MKHRAVAVFAKVPGDIPPVKVEIHPDDHLAEGLGRDAEEQYERKCFFHCSRRKNNKNRLRPAAGKGKKRVMPIKLISLH